MLKSVFIVFYVKGFSKSCIIFIKIIFLGISLPMGNLRWKTKKLLNAYAYCDYVPCTMDDMAFRTLVKVNPQV